MYLLDTNILSELIRPRPDQGVVDWFARLKQVTIPAIILEELSYGIQRAPAGKKSRLETWLSSFLEIPPDVIPVDGEIARLAGRLRGAADQNGKKMTQADALIAATAIRCGQILVTRNTRDFEGLGIGLLNPFERVL